MTRSDTTKETAWRAIFRLRSILALNVWLAVVVVFALFVDRWVLEFMRDGSVFWLPIGHWLEPFGNSKYPILGGLALIIAFSLLGFSFPAGVRRQLIWSLTQTAGLIVLAVTLSGLGVRCLKTLLGRPRPAKYFEAGMYEWLPLQFQHLHVSMPSGHTATVFSIAFVFAVLLPKYRMWIIAAASFVGAGRVMMQYHWPSDVIVGAMLGWLISRMAAQLFTGPNMILSCNAKGDYGPGPVWQKNAQTLRRWFSS